MVMGLLSDSLASEQKGKDQSHHRQAQAKHGWQPDYEVHGSSSLNCAVDSGQAGARPIIGGCSSAALQKLLVLEQNHRDTQGHHHRNGRHDGDQ
jgi:hypothetical protein